MLNETQAILVCKMATLPDFRYFLVRFFSFLFFWFQNLIERKNEYFLSFRFDEETKKSKTQRKMLSVHARGADTDEADQSTWISGRNRFDNVSLMIRRFWPQMDRTTHRGEHEIDIWNRVRALTRIQNNISVEYMWPERDRIWGREKKEAERHVKSELV